MNRSNDHPVGVVKLNAWATLLLLVLLGPVVASGATQASASEEGGRFAGLAGE